MPAITRVVCPVDFSEPSAHALRHAARVASWWQAPLVVLHVYTPVPEAVPVYDAPNGGLTDQSPEMRALQRVAAEFARTAGAKPSGVVTQVGWPPDEIVRFAGSGRETVIVIGTHGARGFRRMMLGSVTEKVVRTALCPVITIPPHAPDRNVPPYKTMLCAVDFSSSSEHAVPLAASLAREGDARLTLLHVVQGTRPAEQPAYARTFSSVEYAVLRDEDAEARLRQLLPADAADWCTPEVQVVHGEPGEEILKRAARTDTDLIVLGVRKRSGIDQAVFGSTTNDVLRAAGCAVMTERA